MLLYRSAGRCRYMYICIQVKQEKAKDGTFQMMNDEFIHINISLILYK